MTEEQAGLAKDAIRHVLNAIANDPRKFWLMGDMTGSYEKLTAAAAALWGCTQDEVKADFRPKRQEWDRYCAQKDEDDRLLMYCRERGIVANRD